MSLKLDFLKRKKNSSLFKQTPRTKQLVNEMYDFKNTIFIADYFNAPNQAPFYTASMNVHLPFNDFTVRGRVNFNDGDTDQTELLVRYKRLSDTKSRLYTYLFREKESVPLAISEFDSEVSTTEYITIFPKKADIGQANHQQKSVLSGTELGQVHALGGFRLFTYAATQLLTFERFVTYTPPTNKLVFKKMRPEERATYVEYTLDLTKKIPGYRQHLGGTHASPREHIRRGHWRTTRSGERKWISAVVVNKDSARGKIDKEYVYGVGNN